MKVVQFDSLGPMGSVVSWSADKDYVLVGLDNQGNGILSNLSQLDAGNWNPRLSADGSWSDGWVLANCYNQFGFEIPISKGSTIYATMTASGSVRMYLKL